MSYIKFITLPVTRVYTVISLLSSRKFMPVCISKQDKQIFVIYRILRIFRDYISVISRFQVSSYRTRAAATGKIDVNFHSVRDDIIYSYSSSIYF